jgi:hypothetical protein
VAFHHHAVQAEEHAAIERARIELPAHHAQRAAREQSADAPQERARQRHAQKRADQLGGTFRGLQRDVAGESVRHHHVDAARADAVAFDEAAEFDGKPGGAQDMGGALHRLDAFDFLFADIEQAHRRPFDAEHDAREGLAHDREIDQLLGAAPGIGADVEHDALTPQRGPDHGDGRARNPRNHAETEHRDGHQRAGVAGGNRDLDFLVGDRIERVPHAGIAPAPERLRRLLRHADDVGGVADLGALGERAVARQNRLENGLVAVQQEPQLGMALARDCDARHDRGRSQIAAHGVDRKDKLLGHDFPTRPLSP